ncbi:unnamed protein product, partial [Phaeothamnion confervicola]
MGIEEPSSVANEAQHVETSAFAELRASCETCSARKKRCDGVQPCCGYCNSRGLNCVYSVKRRRGPAKGTKYRRRQPKIGLVMEDDDDDTCG